MNELDDFLTIHTVTVETFQGQGVNGDSYAAPATITGFYEGKIQLVRNGNGEQVVSNSTLYTYTTNAALFTPDTRVTQAGTVARVITVNVNDSGPLGLPDHVEVHLT